MAKVTLKAPRQICDRCRSLLHNRLIHHRSFSAAPASHSSPPSPPPRPPPPPTPFSSGYTHLSNRALISLTGHDAPTFLQGLTTANIIPPLPSPPSPPPLFQAIYSVFLNAQGRILNDVFIYPIPSSWPAASVTVGFSTGPNANKSPGFLIEVDAAEQNVLLAWLKRYKLRAKITLRALSSAEYMIYSVWGSSSSSSSSPTPPPPLSLTTDTVPLPLGAILAADTRAPGLGYRYLLPASPSAPHLLTLSSTIPFFDKPLSAAPLSAYTIRRMRAGVPEGQAELEKGVALLQESCVDYMGGVDFRKGCYVGQELVIRTQHTGVVRKRIVPVRVGMDGEGEEVVMPGLGARIRGGNGGVERRGRRELVGRWIGGVGNVGLALWRLDGMEAGTIGGDVGVMSVEGAADVEVRALVPEWWKDMQKG